MRAALLAVVLLASGCLAPAGELAPAALDEFVDPIVEQHDHGDPAEHALWTPNMALLAHTTLAEEPNATLGTYGELDVQGDRAYVAILGDGGEVPGLAVVDISERAAPRLLAFAPSPGTRIADVKGEPENEFVFVAAERTLPTAPRRVNVFVNDTRALLASQDVEAFRTRNGIRLFDVSDPTAPREVAFAPSDSGCHMLVHKAYAGGEWVFCVGTAIHVYAFDRAAASLELVARWAPPPHEAAPVFLARPTEPHMAFSYDLPPHDITVEDDAATGKVLLYASYWDLGLRIVDVSDPRAPVELGAWKGEGGERYTGAIHTARAREMPDGRRLVYLIPEITDNAVPALFVLDATELAAPKLVGEWAAPGEHPADALRFSTHNFHVVGDRLYMAYYHAGVWVLDVGGEHATAPAILGYYLPHADVETRAPRETRSIPDVWDLALQDGHIYVSDIPTGLYVLHYAEDALGDPALTSRG